MSAAAGLPTWPDLKKKLVDEFALKAESFGDEEKKELLRTRDQIDTEKNFWNAFDLLQKAMGKTSYIATIRDQLKCAGTSNIPDAYHQIWKLNLAGVLNLNLDRLATRAFSIRYPGKSTHEFEGQAAKHFLHLISHSLPFIANLHGTTEKSSGWVFTKPDLSRLMADEGYKAFISNCFLTHTVVFLGISADDVAAGGHLSELAKKGFSTKTHFWITDRLDGDTDDWAESCGIRIIRYNSGPENRDHSDLNSIIENLVSHTPVEEEVRSVLSGTPEAVELPSPSILESQQREDIRDLLNRKALGIFASDKTSDKKYQEFSDLTNLYDTSVHKAWYFKLDTSENVVRGYTLEKKIGEGAFGQIFLAKDKKGNHVALKILHEHVRNDAERLQSFRRGVNSMQILTERNISRIVKYHDASEIPAMAVMEYVPGENFEEAVASKKVKEWTEILELSRSLAQIILESHSLPERVLHRDIRPSNVIIKNPYDEPSDWEICVLDFDLSWHKDSRELSISAPGTQNGFLAPELVKRTKENPTRSAAVDSYGIGMTMYYLRTSDIPFLSQPAHESWESQLEQYSQTFACKKWNSLPRRFFRLVRKSTQIKQKYRIDVVDIVSELNSLCSALTNPKKLNSVELWAEELACKSSSIEYDWNEDDLTATIKCGGVNVLVRADEVNTQIKLAFSWQQLGNENYKDVRKWLPKAVQKVESILKKSGWIVSTLRSGEYQIEGSATVDLNAIRLNFDRYCEGLQKTIVALQL